MNRRIISGISILTLSILTGLYSVIAQVPVKRSINKVIIEGKVYYIHQVTPGQTIYSISKAYDISENEIIRENPGAEKILSAGQVLKIPVISVRSPDMSYQQPGTNEPVYRKHIIKEGETIYSLSKKYNVPVQELEKANPSLVITDIPVGLVINIPVVSQPDLQVDFIYHRVRRKETIYGICKRYDITEEELIMYNPELKESLPRTGQHLRIPKSMPKEIIYPEDEITAVGDSISVPLIDADSLNKMLVYNYYLDSLPPISGRSLNIAYLIPFNYNPETSDPVIENEELNDINKRFQLKAEINQDILPESKDFLEFIGGALLVIDKLRKQGVSVNIFVFDTKRNTQRVREIISSNQFNKMDLIIGPFFSFNVKIVSEYSLQHRIPVISPFYDNLELTSVNPYLFQICPSYSTEYNLLANYLITNGKGRNIILIQQRDSIQNIKKDYLRSKIIEEIKLSGNDDSIEFKELIFDNADKINFTDELANCLSKTKENLVMINEIDEVVVKPIITQLYFLPKIYTVKLFGLASWMTFQSVDYSYFHKLGLSFFTSYYFSYDSADIKNFLKAYTEEFYAEPEGYTKKGCSYALAGHDISNYFLNLINKYGRRFITHLDADINGQLFDNFQFERINHSGGYENRSLMMMTFSPDLNIAAQKYNYTPVSDSSLYKEHLPGFMRILDIKPSILP